jgi:hypothetical protein
MPDPTVLYAVTAIVVLGLVAWVVVVLSRPVKSEPRLAAGEKAPSLSASGVDAKQDPTAPNAKS